MFRVALPFAALLAASAPAAAAGGFLGYADQKAALLSPAPLGPPATLTLEQTSPQAAPKDDAARPQAQPKRALAQPRRPRADPRDAFARDTRPRPKIRDAGRGGAARQTWPCTGGGICAWTTPR